MSQRPVIIEVAVNGGTKKDKNPNSPQTPEEIADTIGKALQFVARDKLIPCTNCGLAPMSREVAMAKLKALGEGAALARERYGQ